MEYTTRNIRLFAAPATLPLPFIPLLAPFQKLIPYLHKKEEGREGGRCRRMTSDFYFPHFPTFFRSSSRTKKGRKETVREKRRADSVVFAEEEKVEQRRHSLFSQHLFFSLQPLAAVSNQAGNARGRRGSKR